MPVAFLSHAAFNGNKERGATMSRFCFFSRALAVGGVLLLSTSHGWAQVNIGRPVTSTPAAPAFQYPAGNSMGFYNSFTNQAIFPTPQFTGGFFSPNSSNPAYYNGMFNHPYGYGNYSSGTQGNPDSSANPADTRRFTPDYTGTPNPYGAFGYPNTPFYWGAGMGLGMSGYNQVISSYAGSNQPWQPTPSSYYYYRPDIAYTAMLNTMGNPPGQGSSALAMPPQTSGAASLIIRAPEGTELTVDGKSEKLTGGEHKLVSPVLKPGQAHTFHIKAAWYDDNERTLEQHITLGAGESKSLTLLPGVTKVEAPRGGTQP
jgi:uncharacterized protein (TIGR03000 family)